MWEILCAVSLSDLQYLSFVLGNPLTSNFANSEDPDEMLMSKQSAGP